MPFDLKITLSSYLKVSIFDNILLKLKAYFQLTKREKDGKWTIGNHRFENQNLKMAFLIKSWLLNNNTVNLRLKKNPFAFLLRLRGSIIRKPKK